MKWKWCNMKGNFLLEKSLRETIEPLSNEEKGILFQGILDYVNGIEPSLTGALKSIFIPIKKEIDNNEIKYQKRCETNQENGSKGGAPKGNQNARKKNNPEQPKTTENNQTVEKTQKNNRKQHDARHISSIHTSYIINQEKDNKGVIGGEEEKTTVEFLDSKQKLYVDIIGYLNAKTGSNYKASTPKTQKLIDARLKEKFTLEDFKTVIDKKCLDWLNDNKMKQYLRPETLFGTKFEGYLNQPTKNITTNDLPFEYWDF